MIISLFEELYVANKYFVKICNTDNNNWIIYIFNNKTIQVDMHTPNSLISKHIKVQEIIDYIEKEMDNPLSNIKLIYTYTFDDLPEYIAHIEDIVTRIKTYYAENNKTVILKPKCRYSVSK
jgi:hypothetical protein